MSGPSLSMTVVSVLSACSNDISVRDILLDASAAAAAAVTSDVVDEPREPLLPVADAARDAGKDDGGGACAEAPGGLGRGRCERARVDYSGESSKAVGRSGVLAARRGALN